MRRLCILAIAGLGSLVALAQPAPPPAAADGWCGTSPERTALLRARHEWRRDRMAVQALSSHVPRVMERNGTFIVEADETMLVNESLLDLVGTTIRFVPAGDGYRVERGLMAYRQDVGEPFADFSDRSLAAVGLDLPFPFPLFGEERTSLQVTNRNGLFFESPPAGTVNQYEVLDVAALEQPVISPLLLGSFPRTFVPPQAYVRTGENDLVVTWRTDSPDFAYDVQVVLSRDGTIEMSWRSAREVGWGAVVVTPGFDESAPRELIATVKDSLNDGSNGRADQDLEQIEISRLGSTELVEIRFRLRGIVRQNAIPEGEFVQYGLDSSSGSSSRIAVHLTRESRWLLLPGRDWISNPGSLFLEGDEIRILARDRDLESGDDVTLTVWVWESSSSSTTDSAYGELAHSHSTDRFDVDLSDTPPLVVEHAIVESFTLPEMDPYSVWEHLSREYELDPEETDALAVYQSFFTDLVLYAGAYSTVGNPGVDGVSDRSNYGTGHPRFPALLHMSKLGYRYNSEDELSIHVLNHEFGHRWLYFFRIFEEGESRHSLNPAGGHPAQFVHTPAAFDVLGERNSSAMGGSWFEDLGDGTFRARETLASYGYSWHELYLMGLADAGEVEPWYYIENSSPRLGDAYYPPDGIVVSGARRDVTIEQLAGAMGPRVPGTSSSRKRFSTYFVLLVRDLDQVTEEEIADLDHRRRLLQASIPAATGGRASVDTLHGEETPRGRGVRRP